MSDLKVIIKCKFGGIERAFELDTCTERSVQASSNIATHPVQSGDSVSDHMWTLPKQVQLSGTFALRGSWQEHTDCYTDEYINGGDAAVMLWRAERAPELNMSGDRLANIEELFEYIQKSGTLCDICFVERDGSQSRFRIRHNMALQSVSWKEGYETLGYNMSFKEILTVQLQQFETVDIGEIMPALTVPAARTLGQMLSDSDGSTVADIVVNVLTQAHYISDDQQMLAYNYFGDGRGSAVSDSHLINATALSWGLGAFAAVILPILIKAIITVIAQAALAGTAMTAGATLSAAMSAIPVAGWIIAGVTAVAIGVISAVGAISAEEARKRAAVLNIQLMRDAENPDEDGFRRLEALCKTVCAYVTSELKDIVVWELPMKDATNGIIEDCTFPLMFPNGDLTYVQILDNGEIFQMSTMPIDEDTTPDISVRGFNVVKDFDAASREQNALYVTDDRLCELYCVDFGFDDKNKQKYLLVCSGNIKDFRNRLTTAIRDAIEHHIDKYKD